MKEKNKKRVTVKYYEVMRRKREKKKKTKEKRKEKKRTEKNMSKENLNQKKSRIGRKRG